jgi:hypothetical protein
VDAHIRAHLLTQDADRVVYEHHGVERVDALLGRAAVAGIRRASACICRTLVLIYSSAADP